MLRTVSTETDLALYLFSTNKLSSHCGMPSARQLCDLFAFVTQPTSRGFSSYSYPGKSVEQMGFRKLSHNIQKNKLECLIWI